MQFCEKQFYVNSSYLESPKVLVQEEKCKLEISVLTVTPKFDKVVDILKAFKMSSCQTVIAVLDTYTGVCNTTEVIRFNTTILQ